MDRVSFNPRLREEGDLKIPMPIRALRSPKFQSAPSRGRRRRRCAVSSTSGSKSFNPRLREEGDGSRAYFAGADGRLGFNPRLREEGDPSPRRRRSTAAPSQVSIRAFARKATRIFESPWIRSRADVSIRAFARKATSRTLSAISTWNSIVAVSIRAFARKATRRDPMTFVQEAAVFQSAPSRGRRPVRNQLLPVEGTVSIRAFARKAT